MLTPEEKRFLLFVERGDCASVGRTIKEYKAKPYLFDINSTDPLGRSALSIGKLFIFIASLAKKFEF